MYIQATVSFHIADDEWFNSDMGDEMVGLKRTHKKSPLSEEHMKAIALMEILRKDRYRPGCQQNISVDDVWDISRTDR